MKGRSKSDARTLTRLFWQKLDLLKSNDFRRHSMTISATSTNKKSIRSIWSQSILLLLCSIVVFSAPLPSKARPTAALQTVQDDLSSDHRVTWLKAHAIPVRSIDPADDDFSDLKPLKQAIGDAKIVLLGEQTHEDGLTFLAKTRLIKFLHKEMGFDVLTWESGFYDVAKAWELIQGGEDAAASMRRASFPIWTDVEETRALFEYINAAARTKRPLALAGFDCQLTGTVSRDFLVSDLRTFLHDIGIDTSILKAGTPLAEGLDELTANRFRTRAVDFVAPDSAFLEAAGELQKRVASAAASEKTRRQAFWAQLLTSLRQEALHLREHLAWIDLKATEEERRAAFSRMWNLRATQMSENMLWLAHEGYRDHKIIGWQATAHAMRNQAEIDEWMPGNIRQGTTSIGHLLWDVLGQELYALGFTSYDLSAFEPAPRSSQSEEVEFEELMQAAGLEYALVDFRHRPAGGEWLDEPIISRPIANFGIKARWPKVLDGMFFMREWKPSTGITRGEK
jgi:erythromycin esterase